MQNIALFPNHPSQLWMLKPVADRLQKSHNIIWFLRDKDVTLAVADEIGIDYTVLSRAGTGIWGNGIEFLKNIGTCLHLTLKYDIDIWVTKYGCGNIAARVCGRKSIAFNDDDVDVVPLIARTSYPFADRVLVPDVTRMGKYESKAVRYAGSHELFYLHPNRFSPDSRIYDFLGIPRSNRFAVIRLSALTAHHDIGIRGMTLDLIRKVIEVCDGHIAVFVTSEKALPLELERFRLKVPVHRIHDVLFFAEFLIGDSQTMAAESATLGTLSVRVSDFVGRISYIAELERYGLSRGCKPQNHREVMEVVSAAVKDVHFKEAIRDRLNSFLSQKIDPVPWFAEQILLD